MFATTSVRRLVAAASLALAVGVVSGCGSSTASTPSSPATTVRVTDAYVNVAALYLASHLIAHAFDFHLERANGRGWKLFLLVVCSTWILIGFGYGIFNLNEVNVFR